MNKDFLDVINKGVPISTPIHIYLSDLLYISKDKNRLKRQLFKNYNKFLGYMMSKVGTFDTDNGILNILEIKSDPVTLEKKLYFSISGYVGVLIGGLNVDNLCKIDDSNLINYNLDKILNGNYDILYKKIDELKKVETTSTLKRKFPMLYEAYRNCLVENINILDFEKSIKKIDIFSRQDKIKEFEDSYLEQGISIVYKDKLNRALNFSLKSFIDEKVNFFNKFIEFLPYTQDYFDNNSFDIRYIGIDKELLELYIASSFIDFAEQESIDNKQRYIYYLTNYFNSDINRKNNDDIRIKYMKHKSDIVKSFNIDGKDISPKSIYDRYKKLLYDNPELKAIDLSQIDFSSMNLEEVESFVVEYLAELGANWEIIPEIPDYDINDNSNNYNKNNINNNISSNRKDKDLLQLYMDKKELYGSTDPFYRIKGINTFDGYIGFIYSNGRVILDKFFENTKTGRLAFGEAIYIMDISDFYRLSHFPKKYLIEDTKVGRIIHNGNWQSKVLDVVNDIETINSPANEVKELLHSGKVTEYNPFAKKLKK